MIKINENVKKSLDVPPETSFSAKNYFIASLALMALAPVSLFIFPLAAPGLVLVSLWYGASSVVVLVHRWTEDTCLEKPMRYVYALAIEINTMLWAAAVFPWTFSSSYLEPKGVLNGTPILLINGYLSFASTWDYQRKELVDAGFGPIYVMNIGTGRGILAYAEQVAEMAKSIKTKTGKNDLILIGHSKGGVVATEATFLMSEKNENSSYPQVKKVITLGSPLKGTGIAYLDFLSYDARDMRPNSEVIGALLKKKKDYKGGASFYHIASEADEVVSTDSALFEGGEEAEGTFLLKDIPHLALVASSQVAYLIKKATAHKVKEEISEA